MQLSGSWRSSQSKHNYIDVWCRNEWSICVLWWWSYLFQQEWRHRPARSWKNEISDLIKSGADISMLVNVGHILYIRRCTGVVLMRIYKLYYTKYQNVKGKKITRNALTPGPSYLPYRWSYLTWWWLMVLQDLGQGRTHKQHWQSWRDGKSQQKRRRRFLEQIWKGSCTTVFGLSLCAWSIGKKKL